MVSHLGVLLRPNLALDRAEIALRGGPDHICVVLVVPQTVWSILTFPVSNCQYWYLWSLSLCRSTKVPLKILSGLSNAFGGLYRHYQDSFVDGTPERWFSWVSTKLKPFLTTGVFLDTPSLILSDLNRNCIMWWGERRMKQMDWTDSKISPRVPRPSKKDNRRRSRAARDTSSHQMWWG